MLIEKLSEKIVQFVKFSWFSEPVIGQLAASPFHSANSVLETFSEFPLIKFDVEESTPVSILLVQLLRDAGNCLFPLDICCVLLVPV